MRRGKGLYRKVAAALTAAAAPVFLASCTAGGDGSAAKLVMGDSFSAKHPMGAGGTQKVVKALEEMAPELGLEFEYFSSGQLGKQSDMATMVRTGAADIAPISPAYVGSEMPLASVGDLPGLGNDSCVSAYALRNLMDKGGILYEEELKPLNLRALWVGSIPSYEALTANREVRVPGDLKGTVQRSTGGAHDRVVDSVGAAGVAMPIGDLYEAITRGTVEGTVASPVSITPYGLHEVLRYSTKGANLGSFSTVFAINEDTWQSLTLEQRRVLSELADDAQQSLCEGLNDSADKQLVEMEKENVKLIDVSQQRSEWDALARPIRDKWVRDLEAIGRPAGEVMRSYEKALQDNAGRAERGK